MKITGPVRWYTVDDEGEEMPPVAGGGGGRPVMKMSVDGLPASFSDPDRLLGFGAVFLSAEHAGLTSFTVPADQADGREQTVVPGATDDPAIVSAVRQFFAAVDDGSFSPRTFSV